MIADIGLFLLPYVIVFAVGGVLGYMSRNSKIDKLNADLYRAQCERDGIEIRTSRAEPRTEPVREPVRPVQPRTRPAGTARPAYAPGHSATRTEPLPSGMSYVAAEGIDDQPMSDAQYADMMRARFADE